MTMQSLGEDPWAIRLLSDGWHALRHKAHQALTYFAPKDEEDQGATQRWALVATDVVDRKNLLEVRMEIPGMEKADLNVDVLGRHLVISGEKRSESTRKEGTVVVTERAFGQFRRVVPLPCEVDIGQAKARYADGVLAIDLPKKESTGNRRITISGH
jgi:HSP20 family protein